MTDQGGAGALIEGKCQPQAARGQILVADDRRDGVWMRGILQRAGYAVTEVHSGKLAVRAARERAFDLIILDLTLPDMDGFEIIEALGRHLPRPRILAVSGFMPQDLLAAAKALGAVAVLDKHVAADRLLSTVGRLLS